MFECDFCTKKFPTEGKLRRHQTTSMKCVKIKYEIECENKLQNLREKNQLKLENTVLKQEKRILKMKNNVLFFLIRKELGTKYDGIFLPDENKNKNEPEDNNHNEMEKDETSSFSQEEIIMSSSDEEVIIEEEDKKRREEEEMRKSPVGNYTHPVLEYLSDRTFGSEKDKFITQAVYALVMELGDDLKKFDEKLLDQGENYSLLKDVTISEGNFMFLEAERDGLVRRYLRENREHIETLDLEELERQLEETFSTDDNYKRETISKGMDIDVYIYAERLKIDRRKRKEEVYYICGRQEGPSYSLLCKTDFEKIQKVIVDQVYRNRDFTIDFFFDTPELKLIDPKKYCSKVLKSENNLKYYRKDMYQWMDTVKEEHAGPLVIPYMLGICYYEHFHIKDILPVCIDNYVSCSHFVHISDKDNLGYRFYGLDDERVNGKKLWILDYWAIRFTMRVIDNSLTSIIRKFNQVYKELYKTNKYLGDPSYYMEEDWFKYGEGNMLMKNFFFITQFKTLNTLIRNLLMDKRNYELQDDDKLENKGVKSGAEKYDEEFLNDKPNWFVEYFGKMINRIKDDESMEFYNFYRGMFIE